jgi:hypothetical protein
MHEIWLFVCARSVTLLKSDFSTQRTNLCSAKANQSTQYIGTCLFELAALLTVRMRKLGDSLRLGFGHVNRDYKSGFRILASGWLTNPTWLR